MNRSQSNYLPVAALLLAMLLWSSSFVSLKMAFRDFDPLVVIFGRMAVATFCFAFFIKRFKGIDYRKGDLKIILMMGFFEPCLYFVFEAKAIQYTTAAQAGMVTGVLPLLVAVGAGFLLGEQITKQAFAGFGLSILGVCWLSMSGSVSENAPNPILGNFLEFIAMVCAAGYVITLKRLTNRYPSLFLTGIMALTGCVFFGALLFLPGTNLPNSFEPVSTLIIIYLGVFVTLGAYGLFNYGVSKIPAAQATAFINLIPVFGVVLAWLILDERFTTSQYVASLLVLAGVFISQKKIQPQTEVQVAG